MTAPHDETCARCDRRICVCGCQCATCVPVEEGRCRCRNLADEHMPPAERIGDAEAKRLGLWLAEGCTLHAARPAHADAVMADLGAAITEGVTEVRLLDVVTSLYAGARDQHWQEAADLAELVSGDPWNDVDPIRFREWLSERLR